MKNWFLLYATQNLSEASIVKGMLEENSVPVLLINKQDSSYLNFGDIELYVPSHLKDIAKHLVDQGLMN
ncbi:MAG: DUF2007 domain-containing protein [Segetibacter sp.]|jgi:hypothetical protein|nr:DUF2007 domain-containing protein [Segetibacter sp.]